MRFCFIESPIGALDELLRLKVPLVRRCGSDADCRVHAVSGNGCPHLLDLSAERLGDPRGACFSCFRKNNKEFVAAVAAAEVSAPEDLSHALSHGSKHAVAPKLQTARDPGVQ
jgi:hypothetical protein